MNNAVVVPLNAQKTFLTLIILALALLEMFLLCVTTADVDANCHTDSFFVTRDISNYKHVIDDAGEQITTIGHALNFWLFVQHY